MELTTILQALLLGAGVGLLQTLVGLGGGVIGFHSPNYSDCYICRQ
jgi:hypothetical protein